MKKSFLLCLFFCAGVSQGINAQTITTIAGTVASGYTGDGGPATSAELFHPKGTVVDDTGNVYIADADNNVIRKVDPAGIISTFAGLPAGGFSGDGGLAAFALLSRPNSIVRDHAGNMYICDADNQRIRKINTAGIITTIVGDGTPGFIGDGGPATAAEIDFPGSIALDDTGNLYIADEYNNRIRKVDTFGTMTTFAGSGATGYAGEGGDAGAADIGFPFGVAVDHAGNVYFSLTLGNRICKVNTSHVITTIAGTGGAGAFSGDGGPATAAEFDTPWGIATDPAGNVYITDNANERIREVNTTSGIVSTVAGNGSSGFSGDGGAATAAKLRDPAGVYVDDCGNIYIADYNNHRVRKVGGTVTHAPYFTGGHSQAFTICENTLHAIDTVLAAVDSDAGQVETWTIIAAPAHGALIANYSTISSGGLLVPSGLSYTPATGYTGIDSFGVKISDCLASDTTVVHVTINPCSLVAAAINGAGTNSIQIFPNPGEGLFTVVLSSDFNEPAHVVITNIMGEKVREITAATNERINIQINAPTGIYLLNATTAHENHSEKITVIR